MLSQNIIVLGITGLPSSGKGEFSEVAKTHDFYELIMGDVIRNECKRRGLPVNRENSNKIMLKLREERGDNAVALITLEWIETAIKKGKNRILIDGIRSMEEVNTFRNIYPDMLLIAIHADPKTRYQRAKNRKRQDDAYSWDSFHRRDQLELDVGIGNAIALSDIMISSKNNLSSVKNSYNEVINDIIDKKQKIGVIQDGR